MGDINQTHSAPEVASAEVHASVLFVDLDETTLDGTASQMSDEELEQDQLKSATMAKISQARALGLSVVMLTRNTPAMVDRVLRIRDDLNSIFDHTLPTSEKKSTMINDHLRAKGLKPAEAAFIDDNAAELSDVEQGSDGVVAINTNNVSSLNLAA